MSSLSLGISRSRRARTRVSRRLADAWIFFSVSIDSWIVFLRVSAMSFSCSSRVMLATLLDETSMPSCKSFCLISNWRFSSSSSSRAARSRSLRCFSTRARSASFLERSRSLTRRSCSARRIWRRAMSSSLRLSMISLRRSTSWWVWLMYLSTVWARTLRCSVRAWASSVQMCSQTVLRPRDISVSRRRVRCSSIKSSPKCMQEFM
mmetsp:Transcript_15967/g.50929  ORF Transcript_15967/g.50929 Transcript_15967/m.50929 type:complete len:206 (+) Transcript_15967:506-1123(+)